MNPDPIHEEIQPQLPDVASYLRRDFDVEPAALRRPFGFYFERFPVREEVT